MKLPDDLYPYQKGDVDKLLSSEDNYLNLSEMGTGKTPVALAVSQMGEYGKTLIVCPNSLKLEWARQIEDWCGFEPGIARKSCYRRLETLFDDLRGKKDFNPFFILNYETFRTARHLQVLDLYPFDLIVLDEGHRIRRPKTKMTKGLAGFLLNSHKDSRKLVLTGSPIVNNPADLHTLLCLVRPEEYSFVNRMEFIDQYCYYKRGRYGIKVLGARDLEALKRRTAHFTIRHTKQEVLPYLPDKYFRTVLLEMEDRQREIYNSMEKELTIMLDEGEPLHAPGVLALITRLRQLNLEPSILGVDRPSSKTDFLIDLIEDTGDEKLVVFSCFEKYIQFLHRLLRVPHVVLTGSTDVEQRAAEVKRFQEDPSIKLALGTIQVMGEGITLTAASNVVLMDRWWTPAANTQAIDRLHRIGQKNAVQVILPVNEKSIDQSLDKILTKKAKLSSAYLGDDQDIMREVIDDLRHSK